MDLYIYTTPPEAAVELTLDNGLVLLDAAPTTANGREDAHCLELPETLPAQGASLIVRAAGYETFGPHRGLILPGSFTATFQLDDVRLTLTPVAPPEPEPPPIITASDPEGIIAEVYATGRYNLATHEGCGQFTEACCVELHTRHSPMWGHIRKDPGQNQYHGHAVDALMLLAGEGYGIWDIIFDSVSPNAAPSYTYKGPPDPALWYYPVYGAAR